MTYKKLTYDSSKVQVESAIRDEEGVRIMTNYAKKTEVGGVQLLNTPLTFSLITDTTDPFYDPAYPYRAALTDSTITSDTYATVTLSGEQATSGYYSPICRTDTGVLYLYANTDVCANQPNNVVTIPTINLGGGDTTTSTIDSTPTSGSGNAVSSNGVYTTCVRTTGNQEVDGEKTFLDRVSVKSSSVTQPYRFLNQNLPSSRSSFGDTTVDNSMVCVTNGSGSTFADLEFYETANTSRMVQMRLYSPAKTAWKGMALTDNGTDVFVTAPYRTSNLTDNDVLTAGNGVTLSTQQTITGTKYFRNTATYSSGVQYAPVIAFGPDAGYTSMFIGGERSSSTAGAGYFQVFRPSDGQSMGAMFIRTDGTNAWVQAPSRTYSTANGSDVVTIGSLYPAWAQISFKSISGITFKNADNNGWATYGARMGNLLIINMAFDITGTYGGTTGWQNILDIPTSLVASGETILTPYMLIPAASVGLLNGKSLYFINGQTWNVSIRCQVICEVYR